jgi:GT2 family glycosyltransferase
MSISAIVPVWNGRELLERLLVSVAAQTALACEVLVIDNGSSDGAPELAASRGARVIAMGRNAGFAAAVNRGIAEARGEWIAVLNSDVELAPDYFARLRQCDAWFATGKIVSAADPRRIDATFDVLCRGGTAYRVGNGQPDGAWFDRERPIRLAPFTAALFRFELFERVGKLEESFESYLEDVDFGLRCAAAGLTGTYIPAAVARHRGSAALGRWHPETVRRIARNQLLLLARHYPQRLLWRWIWPILVAQLLWGGVALRHGSGLAWLSGKLQGVRDFGAARTVSEPLNQNVLTVLTAEAETIIRETQAAGHDSYWRLYFLLTGGGAK